MFRKRGFAVMPVVLFAAAGFWIAGFIVQPLHAQEAKHSTSQEPTPKPENAKPSAMAASFPTLTKRIAAEVASLESETLPESVNKLDRVNGYYATPPKFNGAITDENVDQQTVNSIMSNRRFVKVFDELRQLDKPAASKIIKPELASALTNYLGLYADWREHIESKIPPGKESIVRPSFAIIVPPEEEGKIELMGARLKVLSLVWLSGMLSLSDAKEQIEQVARVAIKQKTEFENEKILSPEFWGMMVGRGSLYNRQILASGLIGTADLKERQESHLMQAVGITWQGRKLTGYKAEWTEFDTPVRSGFMAPDQSAGTVFTSHTSSINDTTFDKLLQELHFKP